MELYYIPVSTYSQKALIALREKGVEFEPRLVNLMDPEGQAEYREVYPIGKVPLLKPEPDYSVPESTIIIEYLENHYPDQGTKLLPDDPHQARRVRFMDRMTDLYLMNPVGLLFFQSLKPAAERDPARIAEAKRHIGVNLGYLEQQLAERSWLAGDQFTMADCALIPALGLARVSHPYADHASVAAYFERAQQRDSVQQTLAEARPMMEQFMAAQGGQPEPL